mmetsp:Transcript_1733/g.2555  ORF Transcript_1733/g.2555 Transcript_1733/m.2555 type:complete len:144 (+) Transcript_1733:75-506(+)
MKEDIINLEKSIIDSIGSLYTVCLQIKSHCSGPEKKPVDNEKYLSKLSDVMDSYRRIRHLPPSYDISFPRGVIQCVDVNKNPQIYTNYLLNSSDLRKKDLSSKIKWVSQYSANLKKGMEDWSEEETKSQVEGQPADSSEEKTS